MPEQKKEWPLYPEGIYRVVATAQALGKSKKKETPQLALRVDIKQLKKAKDGRPSKVEFDHSETIIQYLTPGTAERAKAFLQGAGFPQGASLAQLDPKHPKHFSLVGYEFDAINKHEKWEDGKLHNKFEALGSSNQKWMENLSGGVSQQKIMQLDAIFGTAPDYSVAKPAVKQEATGEAAPFGPEPTEESDASDFGW